MRGRPISRPNPSVGCIIVRGGKVIGRGWTQAGGRPHAEAMAVRQAGDLSGATVYTTLEPCAHRSARGPACATLLAQARPDRIVVGVLDPDPRTCGTGIASLKDAGIAVSVLDHPLSEESLAGYLTQRSAGRPFITLKLATSLDGRIALADGSSRWITGEAARTHVHARRARQDAILVGGTTWRHDRPRLDVRIAGLEHRSPERMVLSRQPLHGTRTIASPSDVFDLSDLQYLYVEGGASTAAAFLKDDLVDRLDLYRAPIMLGEGLAAIGDLGLADLSMAHDRWTLVETAQLGNDRYEAYRRRR